jgi:hypothetical protein
MENISRLHCISLAHHRTQARDETSIPQSGYSTIDSITGGLISLLQLMSIMSDVQHKIGDDLTRFAVERLVVKNHQRGRHQMHRLHRLVAYRYCYGSFLGALSNGDRRDRSRMPG